jgi:homoserine kinase type II
MAVYTEVDDDALAAFLADYDLGGVTAFKGIAEGVENSNYLLQTETGGYILTLYEKRVNAADLPYFLGLMDHLAAQGFPCPVPVHGRDGQALRRLCNRDAAIVTFLQGVSVRHPSPEHCRALGTALARLHLAGDGFKMSRKNDLSVTGWRKLFDACGKRADELLAGDGLKMRRETDMSVAQWRELLNAGGKSDDDLLSGVRPELEVELSYLESAWPQKLPTGVIHADLFPDNVFFLGSEFSGVIDFYFACNDFFAYDIAVCLNAWCFEADRSFNVTKARNMLSAYRAVRPLSEDELEALPVLARGAAMRFLLTRLFDWLHRVEGALVRVKDPKEYLYRQRFHRSVTGPSAYGIV